MLLAEVLELEPEVVRALARSAARRYRKILLPRPGRAPRRIDAPDEELKAAQRRLLKRLVVKLPVSRRAHGFVPGRSAVSGAAEHSGKEFVVTFDIRDFFPSVKAAAVEALAAELGLTEDGAADFVKLTTLRGRLPQGAPTSPALANLAFRRPDARLGGLADGLNLAYTRYADDLAFSGGPEAARIAASVRKILAEDGFRLAADKTRVMRRSGRQEICGLVVNDGVRLPREARRRLRAILHDVKSRGLEAASHGRGEGFPEWLAGHLAYLAAVDPDEAERLVAATEAHS